MLIKSLTIKNFRCIKELSVETSELTAFVGRNGSGKSTILQAISTFYNIRAPLSEHDFFDCGIDVPIEITLEFSALNPEEQQEFSSYLNDDKLVVTKRILCTDGKFEQKYFASLKQIPQIAEIRRARNTTEKRSRWNDLVDGGGLPGDPQKSVRGDDPDVIMDAYEEEHPDLAEWIPQEVQFLGPPNIGGGLLDKYTRFVYIPAVRDAADDSADKKGATLFQLLDFLVMRRFRARKDVQALQAEFGDRLKELYSVDSLTEFSELATGISQTLNVYVPNAKLNLRVAEPALPEIPNPATIAELVEDDYAGSIDRKGHGLQRALIFSLLQHLAVAEPVEPDPVSVHEDGEAGEESQKSLFSKSESSIQAVATQSTSPDLIVAIEEPELYQHPLRARYLSRILLNMSRESSIGPGGRNQVLYTTHSPYFIDLQRFEQLRIVRKFRHATEEPPCSAVASYTLQNAAERMAELTGRPREQFTADSFRVRAHPVMTHTVNEGFFAEAVVLVEGDTESAALLAVATRLNKDWVSSGIAVVSVEGKTKLDRAAVVFMGLQIPTYVVFDADGGHKDKSEKASTARANRLLLKLCEATEEDYPTTVVGIRHACFENDFEVYCRQAIGEADYERLRNDASRVHGYGKPSEGIKNFDVVMELVNAIYNEGRRLEVLEEIVERVEEMVLPTEDSTEATELSVSTLTPEPHHNGVASPSSY